MLVLAFNRWLFCPLFLASCLTGCGHLNPTSLAIWAATPCGKNPWHNLLHPHQIWTYLAPSCSFFSVPLFIVLGFKRAFQVKQRFGDQTGKCWIGTMFYGSWLGEEEFTLWAVLQPPDFKSDVRRGLHPSDKFPHATFVCRRELVSTKGYIY